MKPLAIAYLITCLLNGKRYIGITSRGLRQRWNEHLYDARCKRPRMAITRAIAKYGPENFSIEALCYAGSWADICALEPVLIEQHGTQNRRSGYNISSGGDGPFGVKHTAEAIERSASKHRGRPCHPNTLAASRAQKGRPKSNEHRARISAARAGLPRSDETKEKLRAYWASRRSAGEFKTAQPYAHYAGGTR